MNRGHAEAWRRYYAYIPTLQRIYSYACLACKSSFKRFAKFGSEPPTMLCPSCAGDAVYLGRDFKPPPKADDAQWRKVRALVMAGFNFFKVGEPYPATLAEVPAFVARNRRRLDIYRRRDPVWHAAIVEAARKACPKRAGGG